jgi:NAD(P)-dependent dehydrogenase (short-subunit alcohol dehydrogenase family)
VASATQCDVTVWDDQVTAFEKAFTQFGKINVVLVNAGIFERGDFTDPSPDEEGKPRKPDLTTLNVDLVGALYSQSIFTDYTISLRN